MENGPFRVPQQPDRRTVAGEPPQDLSAAQSPQAGAVSGEPSVIQDASGVVSGSSSAASHSRAQHQTTRRHGVASTQAQGGRFARLFRSKLFIACAVLVVVVAVVGVTLGLTAARRTTDAPALSAIDTSKYQAVFFTNGQVYFGKLQDFNTQYLKLTDIYYLQTESTTSNTTTSNSSNPQQTTTNDNNVQLIKLGDEIHGPEDEMVIAKEQVLFYENLKPDGKVAQTIAQYQKSKK